MPHSVSFSDLIHLHISPNFLCLCSVFFSSFPLLFHTFSRVFPSLSLSLPSICFISYSATVSVSLSLSPLVLISKSAPLHHFLLLHSSSLTDLLNKLRWPAQPFVLSVSYSLFFSGLPIEAWTRSTLFDFSSSDEFHINTKVSASSTGLNDVTGNIASHNDYCILHPSTSSFCFQWDPTSNK